MAFASADIDAALLMAPTTDSVRADLKTAFDNFHTAVLAEMVTQVGKSATGAEFVDFESQTLDLARMVATSVNDHS
jgi:hypothetical protein